MTAPTAFQNLFLFDLSAATETAYKTQTLGSGALERTGLSVRYEMRKTNLESVSDPRVEGLITRHETALRKRYHT